MTDIYEQAAHALRSSFESDPGARIVQAQGNPLTPYLQGNFDLKRAATAVYNAFKAIEANEAAIKAKAEATLAAEVAAAGVAAAEALRVAGLTGSSAPAPVAPQPVPAPFPIGPVGEGYTGTANLLEGSGAAGLA